MSISRARETVQTSRSEIIRQIDALAVRAGCDRVTMARALQEGFNRELGNQHVEGEDEEQTYTITVTGTVTFTGTEEELDEELDRIETDAENFGIENLSFDTEINE